MSHKQAFGLFSLVLIPALLLGWFGLKASYEDRERTHQNTMALLQARLDDTKILIRRILGDVERQLLKRLERWDGNSELLQELQRKHPLVRQAFWVDAVGMLRYPNMQGPLTTSEQEFFKRTQAIWEGKAILLESNPTPNQPNPSSSPIHQKKNATPHHTPQGKQQALFPPQESRKESRQPSYPTRPSFPGSQQTFSFSSKSRPTWPAPKKTGWGDSILDLAAGRPYGWIAWYWAEGLHLLFWMRTSQAQIVGVEVDRIVLTARLVGNLPDSTSQSKSPSGLLVLHNERGALLYQWGHYNKQPQERSLVQIALPYPLHSWHIDYFGPEQRQLLHQTGRILFHQIALWASVVLALLLLAFYLHRELSRDMREAAQRVNFVTQVSHELKTPLTSIRLYAELLENRIPEDDTRSRRHIHVIVSESQRLSRLIHNILTFSRQHRKQHKIHLTSCCVDDVVSHTIEQFSPTLQSKGIVIENHLQAKQPIGADPDAIEQILNNLLSNVEKYAASGQWVSISTSQNPAGDVTIQVEDRGPGVPAHLQEQVFLPFVRGSDKLSDGVTGTGIGLTIARELARMHQGDLLLQKTTVGACFALFLPHIPTTASPSQVSKTQPSLLVVEKGSSS